MSGNEKSALERMTSSSTISAPLTHGALAERLLSSGLALGGDFFAESVYGAEVFGFGAAEGVGLAVGVGDEIEEAGFGGVEGGA